MIKRTSFVLTVTLDFINKNVTSFPVNLFSIAQSNNILLSSLSKQIEDGMVPELVFAEWGSDDGCAYVYNQRGYDKRIVCYNDLKPPRRVRFTLAHEVMHVVLRHPYDARVQQGSPTYSAEIVEQYEQEANLAAGLLLCHPKTVYSLRNSFNEKALMRVFGVSHDCALRVLGDLYEYDFAIHANHHYRKMKVPELDPGLILPEHRLVRYWKDIWPDESEAKLL